MNNQASPLSETERLKWIDAARGLAILGIFMVNVPAFNAPYFMYGGEDMFWPSSLSRAVHIFIDIFFQASFYTLFSFMFGFGMQMIKDRLEEKQLPYRSILFRRLLVLIGFGLVHAFLIWHGDILLSYGVLGMVLFAFFNASNKALAGWAFGMLLVYVVPISMMYYSLRDRLGYVNSQAITAAKLNYGEGSLLDIWRQNLNDWTYSNSPDVIPYLALSLIPMFLLGMLTARKKWLHEPAKYRGAINKWWIVTGAIFLLFKAGPYLFGNPSWFSILQDGVGGSASAVFYVLSITLLFQTRKGSQSLNGLTWVGRMSLSNYILQSLFSFLLFYSVGLGWYGEVSPFLSFLIVLCFYGLQVYVSKLWLAKYKYGPLEWVWRSLTYMRKQPMKRKQPASFSR
ncbi:DUF418 domain-containing protein [Halobacillus rhizosphaerae]|uniref:DUF418 domain-containing protein n=1 Tax=Halobacillus rhizosphaerae TaxID=3064889 RepID=UPI00398B29D2